MPNKKIINALKNVLRRRGKLTKAQRKYAEIEEKIVIQMYPLTKPADEVKFSPHRTLESYLKQFNETTKIKVLINSN